jgi:hypothetical protein
MMTPTPRSALSFLAIAAVLAVGAAMAGYRAPFWIRSQATLPAEQKTSPAAVPPRDIAKESIPNVLRVESQPPGQMVLVTSAYFDAPGWVVFHDAPEPNASSVLGAAFFPGRPHEEQSGGTTLFRPTQSGGVYYATVFLDDGNGSFDLVHDTPRRGPDGKPLTVWFAVEAGAPSPIQKH